jgi:hypothetical protein
LEKGALRTVTGDIINWFVALAEGLYMFVWGCCYRQKDEPLRQFVLYVHMSIIVAANFIISPPTGIYSTFSEQNVE